MGLLPEYDQLRQNTDNTLNAQKQQSDDAMKRRFAAMGGLNSGSYIKQQQNSDNDMAGQKENAMNQIGFQEAGEAQRRKEVTQGQQFQTGERLGSQEFAGSESALGRAQQQSQFGQSFGLQSKAQTLAEKAQEDQNTYQNKALQQEENANLFNEQMARQQADNPGGIVQGVMGKGGVFGSIGQWGGAGGKGGLLGGGGSYFCTEMHRLGLITKEEYKLVSSLVEKSIFSRPQVVEFYFKKAPSIVTIAKALNHDWGGELLAFGGIALAIKSSEIEKAQDLYQAWIKSMCMKTGMAWDERIVEPSVTRSAVAFLKLLKRPYVRKLLKNKIKRGNSWALAYQNSQA